ncbi:MAG: site-specific integrase [Thermoanaerobaculia bacterium]
MNVQQAIADFLQHGQSVRNLSDRTIRAYQSDLSQFHTHMTETKMVEIRRRISRVTSTSSGRARTAIRRSVEKWLR